MSDIVRRAPRLDIVCQRSAPRPLAERSPLDDVAAGTMFLHASASDVRFTGGAVSFFRDGSRYKNNLINLQDLAAAPEIIENAYGGAPAAAFIGQAGQHFTASAVRGCPAERYIQAHMLCRITTPASPPAAAVGERFLYVADAEQHTHCALRINTALEPDTLTALHQTGDGIELVDASAVVDRTGYFVWSVTSWPDEPARLRKDGAIVASSAGNAMATNAETTAIYIPSFSGDPSRIEIVETQLFAFTGNESQAFLDALQSARIDFYADRFGHVVTA